MIHDVVVLGDLVLVNSSLQFWMRDVSNRGLMVLTPNGMGTSIPAMMRRVDWFDFILPNRF